MALPISTPNVSTAPAAAAPNAGSNTAGVEVAVTGTPPNVDQLLRQIQISGTVEAPPDNGTVTLATALGNFSFSLAQLPEAVKQQIIQQLEALFQSQKPVTAVVQAGSPPSEAVLLLPSSAAPPQAQATAPSPAATQLPLPQVQPLTALPGASFTAVVLPPDIVVPGAPNTAMPQANNAQQPTASGPAQNNPGGNDNTQIVEQSGQSAGKGSASVASAPTTNTSPAAGVTSSSSPQAALSPPTASTASNLTTPASAEAVPQIPASSNAPAPLPQPGKEVIVRIDAASLPTATAPQPTNAEQIPATVIGNGANGQIILKAGDATLYVRSSIEAPIGTHLLITLDTPKPVNPAVLPPVETPNFASLQQVLGALAQADPQLAQQFIETHMPQPNAQLAGPLLFFLNALKQGNIKNWLGDDVTETLAKAGKMELLTRLIRDLGASTQTEYDPSVGEWKSYPVPLQNNGAFQPLMLHVHADGRRAPSNETEGKDINQVRFLIDVRMSRFGPMQLDGLVRPKKLDMIIRSESVLPPGLPQELRNTYLTTIEAMGFTGGLSFQTGRQSWIVPHRETKQSVVT